MAEDLKKAADSFLFAAAPPQCVKSCPFGALTYFTDPEGVVTGYIEGVD